MQEQINEFMLVSEREREWDKQTCHLSYRTK